MIFAANGDRIELSYEDGVVNGKATIKGIHNWFYINILTPITVFECSEIW